jgi:hypothetical protein
MTIPERKEVFVARARAVLSDVLAAEPLVHHVIEAFADVLERAERDVYDVIRSRYIDLADEDVVMPEDLVRIAGLVGLEARGQLPADVFRERLRLFVRAYLQGAGTPQSLLTMAAAELDVIPNGTLQRDGSMWIQPVRRVGRPPDVVRLEENPVYRVEKQPVLARTGTRWSVDNPGVTIEEIVRPEVMIEALADRVYGPSILLEDLGIGWLSPTVSLMRGERLILRTRPDGAFVAVKIAGAVIEDVTDRIELVGKVPDESALDKGVQLRGGDAVQQATALVRARQGVRVIRFCARTPGAWGNGLTVTRTGGASAQPLLEIAFDPVLAATSRRSSDARTTWTISAAPDALTAALVALGRDRFLVQAEDASLHLPLGRSRWMYLDHIEDRGAAGDVRYLARLILDYTQFGKAAHHDTDTGELFRFDNVRAVFGRAGYTVEEERVKVTFSWREARPTAVRLEVPAWIDEADHAEAVEARFDRLANGIRRIKPAGVSTSVVRSLPAESLGIADVFPAGMALQTRSTIGVVSRPISERGLRDVAAVAENVAAASGLTDQVLGVGELFARVSLAADALPVEVLAPRDQAAIELGAASALMLRDPAALAAVAESRMDMSDAASGAGSLQEPVSMSERAAADPALSAGVGAHATISADPLLRASVAARETVSAEAESRDAAGLADGVSAAPALAEPVRAGDEAAASETLSAHVQIDATSIEGDAALAEAAGVHDEAETG